jgi:hypothetical protein
VAAQGTYAFIGNGSLLQVLDISDPLVPRIVNEQLLSNGVGDIQLRGNFAFVCRGDSLMILDVSSPPKLVEVSAVAVPAGASQVIVQDSLAYVRYSLGSLSVIDITDIGHPRLRGSVLANGWSTGSTAFVAKGPYIYVGSDQNPPTMTSIVDASNPDSPYVAAWLSTSWAGSSAAIQDTFLYMSNFGPDPFEVYSIVNPTAPRLLTTSLVIPEAYGLAIRDSLLYAATDSAIYSLSIALPEHPEVVAVLPMSHYSGLMAFTDKLLLARAGIGFDIIDISSAHNPRHILFFPTVSRCEAVALKDNLALMATGLTGLWILDVTDLASPKALSNISTHGWAVDVVTSGNYAFVVNWPIRADSAAGIWVIDISDPGAPQRVAYHRGIVSGGTLSSTRNSLALWRDLLFVTQVPAPGSDSALEVIDVSIPTEPRQLSVIRSIDAYDADAKDSVLYICAGPKGLMLYDIRDPIHPALLDSLGGDTRAIVLRDTLAFIERSGITVMNITRADSPVYLGSCAQSLLAIASPKLAISDNFLYLVEGEGRGFDVSDPRRPQERFGFSANAYDGGTGIAAQGGLVYFTGWLSGLYIWRNQLVTSVAGRHASRPTTLKLLQNYPNPFNSQTTIEFIVPERAYVKLDVFDLLGRRVRSLLDGTSEAGTRVVRFDASSLSSGVYVVRLRTARGVLTKTMMHVK